MAMQMRYLQALAEVAADKNSTIIFPLPIELLAPFLKHAPASAQSSALANGTHEDASEPTRSDSIGTVGQPAANGRISLGLPAK
jgi:hypothetical protein